MMKYKLLSKLQRLCICLMMKNLKSTPKMIPFFRKENGTSRVFQKTNSLYFYIITLSNYIVTKYVSKRIPVSYTHLRAHETRHDLVCRLLLEKKKKSKHLILRFILI